MSITNRETLKTYFENGDVPDETQFSDLIDSLAILSGDNISVGNWDIDGDVNINGGLSAYNTTVSNLNIGALISKKDNLVSNPFFGSVVQGRSGLNGNKIQALGFGSTARGVLDGTTGSSQISAFGNVSTSLGYVNSGFIFSDGIASVAGGRTNGGSIQALGSTNIAWGYAGSPNDNIIADSNSFATALGYAVSSYGSYSLAHGISCLISPDARYSYALGWGSQALHPYSFVWNSDEYNTEITTTSAQFVINALNGVKLGDSLEVDGDTTLNGTLSTTVLSADSIYVGNEVSINDVTFTGETTSLTSLTAAEFMVVKLNGQDRVIQLYEFE